MRSLLLSGTEFNKDSFLALGGWCEFDKDACSTLAAIFNQAPVARMQAKRGLYGLQQSVNQEEMEVEKKLFNAVVSAKDYSRESEFMSHADYKEKFQEEISASMSSGN